MKKIIRNPSKMFVIQCLIALSLLFTIKSNAQQKIQLNNLQDAPGVGYIPISTSTSVKTWSLASAIATGSTTILTQSTNVTVSGSAPNYTISSPSQSLSISGNTISLSATGGSVTIPTQTTGLQAQLTASTNITINSNNISSTTPTLSVVNGTLSGSYPTQTLTIPTSSTTVLTASTNITVSGTAPNYTISTPTQTAGLLPNTTSLTINGTTKTFTSTPSFTVGDALVANPLSQFSPTTSAGLATVISDETGSGSLVFGTAPTFSSTVTLGQDATTGLQAVTYQQFQLGILGRNDKEAVKYATTGTPLPTVIYANGASGVGATLTGAGVGALAIDGNTVTVGQRILVKDQLSNFQNGSYTVTTVGSGIAVFVLTRSTDFNQSSEISTGATFFVTSGSTLGNTTWILNSADNPVIGTDPITFVQTTGAGSYLAGSGINITGTTISIPNSGVTNAMLANGAVANLSGTNTGDQTITLTGDATGSGTGSFATTLATVNTNTGTWGSAANTPTYTVNGKGLITASGTVAIAIAESQVTSLTSDLALKAPLASPALTGVPTAPTAASSNSTTQVATTAYVDRATTTANWIYDIHLTADQTTTSSTAGNVTEMIYAVAANSVYTFSGAFKISCNNTGGVKFAVTVPSGGTVWMNFQGSTTSNTTYASSSVSTSGTLSTVAFCAEALTREVIVSGHIVTSSTAGNMQFQYASGTNTQTSTIFTNSFGRIQKVQ